MGVKGKHFNPLLSLLLVLLLRWRTEGEESSSKVSSNQFGFALVFGNEHLLLISLLTGHNCSI